MKYTFVLFFFAIINCCNTVQAQNKANSISGIIRNIQNKPVAGATVSLYGYTDTSIVKKTSTADNGVFLFKQLPYGNYSLTITNIGFKDYTIGKLHIDTQYTAIVLPVIILQPAVGKSLQEIVVASKKPLIEQKIDRTIINVDAMITAAGSDAADVLSKSPGVRIDANDDISLNGKNNVLVLIDDKPTYMSSKDLIAYLRSLPGAVLDKLELISNPPARYDANGSAIINIVLKKNQIAGFNGGINVGYNQGVYARNNDALNINYRTKQYNVFGNISYSYDQNFSDQSYRRYFYKSDGSSDKTIFQNSYFTYRSNSWNGRIGIDYFIAPHTTLGIVVSGNTRPKQDVLEYGTQQFDPLMQLDSVVNGFTNGKYSWKNDAINLNCQHSNKNGRSLMANLDQVNYYAHNDQQSPVYFYKPDGSFYKNEQRLFDFPSTINIYTGKLDYTEPLKGTAVFTAGIKSSYVRTNNEFNWYSQQGGNTIPDYSRSNHFKYAENINAAYVNLKKEWKRWSMQAGVRMEHTNGSANQLSNPAIPDISFTTHYTNLFPSLFILRKLDSAGNNTMVLSFSKRIDRPSYQQLNPFLFFVDQYTYSAGNPQLKASFKQYVELRYSYKQCFGITISYGGGNNGINRITQANGSAFISTPLNFIDNRLFGIIPYCSLSPTKWWRVTLNGVILLQSIKGNTVGVTLNQHTNVHEIETSNQFSIGKKWTAELNGFFPGRQSYGQIKNDAVYNISAGIQKSILKGQGSIRFNVNDISQSLNLNSQTVGIVQVAEYASRKKDSRWIGFSCTYRFGKMSNARKRNDTGGAEDEKARTNNPN